MPIPTNGLVFDATLAAQLPVAGLGTRNDKGEVTLAPAAAATFGSAAGKKLLKYVATCALDYDEALIVGGERFPGFYGLAPEWATESCDGECQQWVSACLYAHVNAKGTPYPISLRGEHPGLRTTDDAAAKFTHQEAAFYGNVFQHQSYGCWASIADNEQHLAGRICGELDGDCGFTITGPCTEPFMGACTTPAGQEGGFADCHTGKFDEYPRSSPLVHQVVTVYLQP